MQMHDETVAMVGDLLGQENAVGNITTGGSESNLCAVLSAKSQALATGKSRPGHNGSMVLPRTAHYSFFKAGHLFDIEPIVVDPVPGTFYKIDPEDMRRAVREDTVLMIATAGVWPFGTVDPIAEIGETAEEKDLYFHVDGCFGGFILPFLEKGGHDMKIPAWDFRVKGVCSISADFHKNGMVPPPASCIVFRDEEHLSFARKIAPPNGCLTGTRATGPMVAAWTMLNLVGLEGYIAISRKSMELRKTLEDGIKQIAGLELLPDSKINMVVIYSREYDLMPVITELRKYGWVFAIQPTPPPISLQIIAMPQNDGQIEPFLDELKRAMKLAQPIKSVADIKTYREEYPTGF
jgi:glutamate/tyrosine decarboxylase-like PLP-dependent enzyme